MLRFYESFSGFTPRTSYGYFGWVFRGIFYVHFQNGAVGTRREVCRRRGDCRPPRPVLMSLDLRPLFRPTHPSSFSPTHSWAPLLRRRTVSVGVSWETGSLLTVGRWLGSWVCGGVCILPLSFSLRRQDTLTTTVEGVVGSGTLDVSNCPSDWCPNPGDVRSRGREWGVT